jgi:biopolymer transport protein ExbD
MMFLERKQRREPFQLQLTALIDVFSMLVIFLIKGTVFGMSDIAVPEAVRLPESVSREMVESAPQLIIGKEDVRISILQKPISLQAFADVTGPQMVELKKQLKAYVQALPIEARSSGVLLNVVSDRETSYRKVFDTVKVFREVGFETLLLVATAPPQRDAQDGI